MVTMHISFTGFDLTFTAKPPAKLGSGLFAGTGFHF